jgi:hypothetical protein
MKLLALRFGCLFVLAFALLEVSPLEPLEFRGHITTLPVYVALLVAIVGAGVVLLLSFVTRQ